MLRIKRRLRRMEEDEKELETFSFFEEDGARRDDLES